MPPGWERCPSTEVDYLYSLLVGHNDPLLDNRSHHILYGSITQLVCTLNLDEALARLAMSVQTLAALLAKDHLFVHAGVAGWQGQAILILAPPCTGKTRLVKALVEAGATYYSDTFAIIDLEGRVHHYPVPLSVRDEGCETAGRVAIEQPVGCPNRPPLPVGLIVSTKYRPGTQWQPQELARDRALQILIENMVAGRHKPRQPVPPLQQIAREATVIQSERGEAAPVVQWLLHYLTEKRLTESSLGQQR